VVAADVPLAMLRLIRIQQPGKKTVYLLTNVLDQSQPGQHLAAMLYELRGGRGGLPSMLPPLSHL